MPTKNFKVFMRSEPFGRFTGTGKFVLNLNVYDTSVGEHYEKRWRLVLWKDLAEAFCEHFEGCDDAKLLIQGYEREKSYENDKGETITYTELSARRIWELDGTEREMNTAEEIKARIKNEKDIN